MWTRLLEKEYVADPLVQFEMRKKLDLEKFQIEVSIQEVIRKTNISKCNKLFSRNTEIYFFN